MAAANINLNLKCFWETKPRADQSDVSTFILESLAVLQYIFRSSLMFHFGLFRRWLMLYHEKWRTHTYTHTRQGLKISRCLTKSHCFSAATMALFRKGKWRSYLCSKQNQFRDGGGSYINVDLEFHWYTHYVTQCTQVYHNTPKPCAKAEFTSVEVLEIGAGLAEYFALCMCMLTMRRFVFVKEIAFVLLTTEDVMSCT